MQGLLQHLLLKTAGGVVADRTDRENLSSYKGWQLEADTSQLEIS